MPGEILLEPFDRDCTLNRALVLADQVIAKNRP